MFSVLFAPHLPCGAPKGPYLLSPPSTLTGWPAQTSTVSRWLPGWGLYPGDLTSSSAQRWLKMHYTRQPCHEREARSWRVLMGLGLPFLGGFSLPPNPSPCSLGQFSFKDSAAFLFTATPPRLPTTTVLFLSLSPLFFFFNMQVAMKNLLMKYLLRSLLWARLITYLCLSLASHILNTHLLSI